MPDTKQCKIVGLVAVVASTGTSLVTLVALELAPLTHAMERRADEDLVGWAAAQLGLLLVVAIGASIGIATIRDRE